MDETLINAFPIDEKKKQNLDFGLDFEFQLPNGNKYGVVKRPYMN